jgi:hypothetical protein
VKQNKSRGKELESLSLETLPSSSLFEEIGSSIPPIQPPPYGEVETEAEETLEEFDFGADEEALVSEEAAEVEADQSFQDDNLFHPQDITWEYLKGLEKISLLTPEKEVELAKRIKEGEEQVRILDMKTSRIKAQLIAHPASRGTREAAAKGAKARGKNDKKSKFTPAEVRRRSSNTIKCSPSTSRPSSTRSRPRTS